MSQILNIFYKASLLVPTFFNENVGVFLTYYRSSERANRKKNKTNKQTPLFTLSDNKYPSLWLTIHREFLPELVHPLANLAKKTNRKKLLLEKKPLYPYQLSFLNIRRPDKRLQPTSIHTYSFLREWPHQEILPLLEATYAYYTSPTTKQQPPASYNFKKKHIPKKFQSTRMANILSNLSLNPYTGPTLISTLTDKALREEYYNLSFIFNGPQNIIDYFRVYCRTPEEKHRFLNGVIFYSHDTTTQVNLLLKFLFFANHATAQRIIFEKFMNSLPGMYAKEYHALPRNIPNRPAVAEQYKAAVRRRQREFAIIWSWFKKQYVNMILDGIVVPQTQQQPPAGSSANRPPQTIQDVVLKLRTTHNMPIGIKYKPNYSLAIFGAQIPPVEKILPLNDAPVEILTKLEKFYFLERQTLDQRLANVRECMYHYDNQFCKHIYAIKELLATAKKKKTNRSLYDLFEPITLSPPTEQELITSAMIAERHEMLALLYHVILAEHAEFLKEREKEFIEEEKDMNLMASSYTNLQLHINFYIAILELESLLNQFTDQLEDHDQDLSKKVLSLYEEYAPDLVNELLTASGEVPVEEIPLFLARPEEFRVFELNEEHKFKLINNLLGRCTRTLKHELSPLAVLIAASRDEKRPDLVAKYGQKVIKLYDKAYDHFVKEIMPKHTAYMLAQHNAYRVIKGSGTVNLPKVNISQHKVFMDFVVGLEGLLHALPNTKFSALSIRDIALQNYRKYGKIMNIDLDSSYSTNKPNEIPLAIVINKAKTIAENKLAELEKSYKNEVQKVAEVYANLSHAPNAEALGYTPEEYTESLTVFGRMLYITSTNALYYLNEINAEIKQIPNDPNNNNTATLEPLKEKVEQLTALYEHCLTMVGQPDMSAFTNLNEPRLQQETPAPSEQAMYSNSAIENPPEQDSSYPTHSTSEIIQSANEDSEKTLNINYSTNNTDDLLTNVLWQPGEDTSQMIAIVPPDEEVNTSDITATKTAVDTSFSEEVDPYQFFHSWRVLVQNEVFCQQFLSSFSLFHGNYGPLLTILHYKPKPLYFYLNNAKNKTTHSVIINNILQRELEKFKLQLELKKLESISQNIKQLTTINIHSSNSQQYEPRALQTIAKDLPLFVEKAKRAERYFKKLIMLRTEQDHQKYIKTLNDYYALVSDFYKGIIQSLNIGNNTPQSSTNLASPTKRNDNHIDDAIFETELTQAIDASLQSNNNNNSQENDEWENAIKASLAQEAVDKEKYLTHQQHEEAELQEAYDKSLKTFEEESKARDTLGSLLTQEEAAHLDELLFIFSDKYLKDLGHHTNIEPSQPLSETIYQMGSGIINDIMYWHDHQLISNIDSITAEDLFTYKTLLDHYANSFDNFSLSSQDQKIFLNVPLSDVSKKRLALFYTATNGVTRP